jgi:hypothetical protein
MGYVTGNISVNFGLGTRHGLGAVHQLQRRIRLVDGIINIGFHEKCDYSMKVYAPAISY